MSTEHVSDHDLEYGPNPPGAKYEHSDIDPAVGYKFAVWLAVAMALSFGIVYGAFRFFDSRAASTNAAAQRFPLAASVEQRRPTPALQTQPFRDLYLLRGEETKRLEAYGWVDKDGGVTHIPVERAMELMLQKGFPVRTDAAPAGGIVQDSSSGRTVAPR